MKKFLPLLLALLCVPELVAGQTPDEKTLLKSWGFKLTAKGTLIFDTRRQQDSGYQPWNPDLSKYKPPGTGRKTQKLLQPLIISSKDPGKR